MDLQVGCRIFPKSRGHNFCTICVRECSFLNVPLDGERSVALLQLPDMGSKLRLLLLYLNLLLDGHCGAAVDFFFLRSRDRSAVLPISFFEGPHTLPKVRVCFFGGCVSDVSSVHKVF